MNYLNVKLVERALNKTIDNPDPELAEKLFQALEQEKPHINMITATAYQSGALGEINSLIKLLEENKDVPQDSLLEILRKRKDQIK